MNEIKVVFDEENNEAIFSTNVGVGFTDSHFILSNLTEQEYQQIFYSLCNQAFKYYRNRILDENVQYVPSR